MANILKLIHFYYFKKLYFGFQDFFELKVVKFDNF